MEHFRNRGETHLATFLFWVRLVMHVGGDAEDSCASACLSCDVCVLADEVKGRSDRTDALLQSCSEEDGPIEKVAEGMLRKHFAADLEEFIVERIARELHDGNACEYAERNCFCELFDEETRDPAEAKPREVAVGYKCDEHFIMAGPGILRCTHGKWDSSPPICSCPPGTYGPSCRLHCYCEGSNYCDVETGACQGGCAAGWHGPSCGIEESCKGEPPVIANGKAKRFQRKPGSRVSYECVESAIIFGHSTVHCRFGKWDGDPPICSCPPGTYGENCKHPCHCAKGSDSCNGETGACIGGCSTGWVGISCNFSESCGPPPTVRNGYSVDGNRTHHDRLVKYACLGNRTLVQKEIKLKCYLGEFIGELPSCLKGCDLRDLNRYDGIASISYRSNQKLTTAEDVRCRKGYFRTYETYQCLDGTLKVLYDPCVKGYFDLSFALLTAAYALNPIVCRTYGDPEKIEFSRVLDTGSGTSLPMNAAKEVEEHAVLLDLTGVNMTERFGAYQCEISHEYGSFKIITMIQRYDYLTPWTVSKVANVGDTVKLGVTIKHGRDIPLKWRHNGVYVPAWDGQRKVKFSNVQLSDAGIYECFYERLGRRVGSTLMRLVVRKCRENWYGKDCDQKCPPCYNGGTCHDDWGVCVCPGGFDGANCEKACGDGLYGALCVQRCLNTGDTAKCGFQYICNHFGCSCASGYLGAYCDLLCEPGWYGANCKQRCNCVGGPYACDRFTGACDGACNKGWTGDSCHIVESCGPPPAIDNGYPVDGNSTIQGAFVKYACRVDWTLVEDEKKLICHSGEYIHNPPKCMKNCNASDLDRYEGLEVLPNTIYKHSEILDVRCEQGLFASYPIITCRNGTWEVPRDPCTKGYFDADFTLRREPFLFNLSTLIIHCYSDENYEKIEISRALDTGKGKSLPHTARKMMDRNKVTLSFTDELQYDGTGAFQCNLDKEHGPMKIVLVIAFRLADLQFWDESRVANIGDTVKFALSKHDSAGFEEKPPIRWKHNGLGVTRWSYETNVQIRNVQVTDAGIYECFHEGKREAGLHAITRLIVRKCKENMFGRDCQENCPPCYNGGVCHDLLGICVCPAGFTGDSCGIACGGGLFGTNCSKRCGYKLEEESCKGNYFCKPDPFGCSCAPGFEGLFCVRECDSGWYGADCKQPCHCAGGSDNCNRFTGACAGGCSAGWRGDSCQIEDTK